MINFKILTLLAFITFNYQLKYSIGFQDEKLEGKWVHLKDSIDFTHLKGIYGIANGMMPDKLAFKKGNYEFNYISQNYSETGKFNIQGDSIWIERKRDSRQYGYKINRLSKAELIIEEVFLCDTSGYFKVIGTYQKK